MRPARLLAVALLLTSLAAPVVAQSQDSSPDIKALASADQVWDATFAKCDVQAMDRLVGTDLAFINVGGVLNDKASFLKILGGCPVEGGMHELVTARLLGENIGNVISRLGYHLKNQTDSRYWLANRIYIKRNGAWLLVSASHTSTKPPEAPK